MKRIKKNYKQIFMYIGLFFILFYPFNISFKDYIYVNEYMNLAFQIFGILLVTIPNFAEILNNIKNNRKIISIIAIIAIALIFLRNGDIINGHFGMPFYIFECFLILIIFSTSNEWRKVFANVFMIFIIEHIIGTWFCFIFKEFYYNNIMGIFKDFSQELLYQYEHGQIAGFTQHYSTNATYLLQGVVFEAYFLNFNIKENKKNIINYIILILNIGAILLTGKRAQLFFGIIAIFITFILKNKGNNINIIKKYYKQIGIVTILSALIIVAVPAFRGSIVRVYEGLTKKDMFLTREPMNNLAIKTFKEKPIVGNGWGTYKYSYHNEIVNKERSYMDAHNIYLQILSEVGIIGQIIFIGTVVLLFVIVIRGIRNVKIKDKRYLYIFLAYHIYILLEGMVGNSIYDIPVIIPYSFFLAMALNTIREEEKNGR